MGDKDKPITSNAEPGPDGVGRWEDVDAVALYDKSADTVTTRLRIPEGWLYRTVTSRILAGGEWAETLATESFVACDHEMSGLSPSTFYALLLTDIGNLINRIR